MIKGFPKTPLFLTIAFQLLAGEKQRKCKQTDTCTGIIVEPIEIGRPNESSN